MKLFMKGITHRTVEKAHEHRNDPMHLLLLFYRKFEHINEKLHLAQDSEVPSSFITGLEC